MTQTKKDESPSFNRSVVIVAYFSSMSNPIHFLLRSRDTMAVVPEPIKGSRTKSPSCVVSLMQFSTSCGGNGAGGSIWLRSSVITTTGELSVSSGGNDGKIRYDAHTINDDNISGKVLGISTDIQKPHHISYNSGDIYIRNNTETIQEYTIKIIE